MKSFEELNYYEILEIPLNASSFEIRQAYKNALSIYNEDSLSTYNFFTYEDRGRILKKIEEAFLTLIDDTRRDDYNKILMDTGEVDASMLNQKALKKPIPLFSNNNSVISGVSEEDVVESIKEKIKEKDVEDISSEILSKEIIAGDDLRKIRERIGIDLEEVYEATRISIPTLQSIEDDQFEKLPPAVYLKNFLRLYAELLQMDSDRVIKGYMRNLTSA